MAKEKEQHRTGTARSRSPAPTHSHGRDVAPPSKVVTEIQRRRSSVQHTSMPLTPARGIDISHHQGAINWSLLQGAGVGYAFIKTSEGADFRDQRFAENWQGAKQIGAQRGAYHFFRADADPTREADNFVQSLGGDVGELPPVLDVETNPGLPREVYTQRVKAWLDRVEQLTGKRPMIYTSASVWNGNTTRPDWAASYPLWVAQYGTANPTLPAGWSKADFWQFSDKGKLPGIAGNVDLNVGGFQGAAPTNLPKLSGGSVGEIRLNTGRALTDALPVAMGSAGQTVLNLQSPAQPSFAPVQLPAPVQIPTPGPGEASRSRSTATEPEAKGANSAFNTPWGNIGDKSLWDWAFIIAGAILLLLGVIVLMRDNKNQQPAAESKSEPERRTSRRAARREGNRARKPKRLGDVLWRKRQKK